MSRKLSSDNIILHSMLYKDVYKSLSLVTATVNGKKHCTLKVEKNTKIDRSYDIKVTFDKDSEGNKLMHHIDTILQDESRKVKIFRKDKLDVMKDQIIVYYNEKI